MSPYRDPGLPVDHSPVRVARPVPRGRIRACPLCGAEWCETRDQCNRCKTTIVGLHAWPPFALEPWQVAP